MSSLRVIELTNRHGDTVSLLNLGARICSLELQLRSGPRNVVLGYPEIDDYIDEPNYMGCTVGRYGNRIARASFVINSQRFALSVNDGSHHLHGGAEGFDRRLWGIKDTVANKSATFELESADGDQGYPGKVYATAQYDWNDDRELEIRLRAESDAPTFVNLTNHAYFNLDGHSPDILQHTVSVNGDRIAVVDEELIPTGALMSLDDSILDFRRPRRLADAVNADLPMIAAAGGIDFSYILNGGKSQANARSSRNDLEMSLHTSCPCLHLYTGQNLAGAFRQFAGFCMEPQFLPDSPNHDNFPTTLLQPGEQFVAVTRYRFAESPPAVS